MTIVATPIAQIDQDVGDNITFLSSMSDPINPEDLINPDDSEHSDCGPDTSNHAFNENVDDNQIEDIFRREASCPNRMPRIDPLKLRPAVKQKVLPSQESCAKYPETRIGTCQGPEYSWISEEQGFRFVLNCLEGKLFFFI